MAEAGQEQAASRAAQQKPAGARPGPARPPLGAGPQIGLLQRAVGNQAVNALLARGSGAEQAAPSGIERSSFHAPLRVPPDGWFAAPAPLIVTGLVQRKIDVADMKKAEDWPSWEKLQPAEQTTVRSYWNDASLHPRATVDAALVAARSTGVAQVPPAPAPDTGQAGPAPNAPVVDLAAVEAAAPEGVDADALAGADALGAAVVAVIKKMKDGTPKTEALRTLGMFMYVKQRAPTFTALLSGAASAAERTPILQALAGRLSAVFGGRDVLEASDLQAIAKGTKTFAAVFGEGMAAIAPRWAEMTDDADRLAYLEQKVAHEPSKGYTRRVALSGTPIAKFRSPDEMLYGFFTSNSAGAPAFAGSKSWGKVTRVEEFREVYAIPERRKDAREMLVQATVGLLFDQFNTTGLPKTRTAFTAYVNRSRDTLTGIFGDCGVGSEASDLIAAMIAWVVEYSLVADE